MLKNEKETLLERVKETEKAYEDQKTDFNIVKDKLNELKLVNIRLKDLMRKQQRTHIVDTNDSNRNDTQNNHPRPRNI